MMGAVRTSETSVHFNVSTLPYVPEDSTFHTYNRISVVWTCFKNEQKNPKEAKEKHPRG
jgi:hypothetical protein